MGNHSGCYDLSTRFYRVVQVLVLMVIQALESRPGNQYPRESLFLDL